MKTLFHRLCAAVQRGAKALWPRLRAFWDRFGYATSMLLLLALIGTAASIYRSHGATSELPAPTATPEPALLSSAVVEAEAEEEVAFRVPVQGEIVGEYRPDEMIWSDTLKLWQTHEGIDIAAPLGTAVYASAAGTVTEAYCDPLLGYTVRLEHEDGRETLYACLQSAEMVEAGESVEAGAVIGAVGESADGEAALGAHLHFAMYLDGEAVEPPFEER